MCTELEKQVPDNEDDDSIGDELITDMIASRRKNTTIRQSYFFSCHPPHPPIFFKLIINVKCLKLTVALAKHDS